MGEAKRRAGAYEEAKRKLLGSLTGNPAIVAETAIMLFEGFILPNRYTGGCYLTNMILHCFLKDELGIETEVVVGYVNDGTDDIMISHAWLEHAGLKTDLTIHRTEAHQFQGPLLVCDQVLSSGNATYTYYRQRTQAGLVEDMRMLADPGLAAIASHKAEEHQVMLVRAKNPVLMKAYLDSAPEDQGYEAMASVLRR